jgi:uncharacterized membrane protein
MPGAKGPWIRVDRYNLPQRIKKNITLLFFLLLIVVVFPAFVFSFCNGIHLSSYQVYLVVVAVAFVAAAIVFGGLAFWYHRDKIAMVSEAAGEAAGEERERKSEFGAKFPRVNRIPGIRWFVRWMYKEGWLYSVGLILLLAIGLGLRLWNLGGPSFGDDELITAYAAKGFADTGNFVLPSGFVYNSYWLDLLFRALSIKLFGFNEFGARLPSVIFGSLTIGLAYLVGRELGGKKVGLIAAFIICFLPWEVSWSREARMYALFQFLYLGLVYTTYLALVKYRKLRWYILSFILLIATFATHTLGIVFISVPYCWVLLNFWQRRQLRRFLAMLCAALVLCLFFLLYYDKLPFGWSVLIDPFSSARLLGFLFYYQLPLTAIGILGMFCLILSKNKLGIFITISFIIPLAILTCFLGQQSSQYIYFLIPLLVVTGSFVLVYLWYLTIPMFRARRFAKALPILILATLIFALVPFQHTFQIPQANVIDWAEITVFDATTHPDWKGLKREFSYPIEEGTAIIVTNPLAILYYFGADTHVLRRESAVASLQFFYQDEQGRYRGKQTGAIWISDYGEFISVIQNNDAFLIVDHRFSPYYVTEDVIDYVNQNGNLLGSKGELRIYFLEQII